MADNVELNTGTGGAIVRTDDDGTAHWQYVKLAFGADNTQTIASTTNPIPVDLRADNLGGNIDVNIAASGATVTVSGTVTANAGTGTLTVTDDGSFVLAANSGVDIGDVDVLSVIPGTGATNLGKSIDSVGGATDTGVVPLAIRDDALTTLTPIDGDYVALRVGSTGALHVAHAGTLTVTDDGAFTLAANSGVDIGDVTINNAAGASAVNIQDGGNSITIDGAVSGSGTFTVTDDGSFTLAANTGVDIGDVTINNASGGAAVNIQDGGNSITIDGTVTANAGTGTLNTAVTSSIPGTGATNLGKAEDAAHTTGDTGVMGLAVRRDADTTLVGTDGDYAPLQVDANGYLKVEIFPGGGTHTITGTVSASNTAGNVAHDGADNGNPVKIGGVARTAHPTAVQAGDRVNIYADDLGRLVTSPHVPRDRIVHNHITLTSTTNTSLIAAGGAGVFRDIIALVLSNESATEVRVDIGDGANTGATTDRMAVDLAADGGGATINLPVPLTMGTANHLWAAQLSAAVSTVYVTAIAVENN